MKKICNDHLHCKEEAIDYENIGALNYEILQIYVYKIVRIKNVCVIL